MYVCMNECMYGSWVNVLYCIVLYCLYVLKSSEAIQLYYVNMHVYMYVCMHAFIYLYSSVMRNPIFVLYD